VRHKVLDLVGDLSLAGRPIHAHIRACRSGHRLNGALAARLAAAVPQPAAA
jgi:UDP-3-O-acyl-N-acetylglucosamine deacetylase